MQWNELPHGLQLKENLEVSLLRLLYSNVPKAPCLPWVAEPGHPWLKGLGALAKYVPSLGKCIKGVTDDFGRHVEHLFELKLQPRNCYLADIFDDKLENMSWKVAIPKRVLTMGQICNTMHLEGIDETHGFPESIWSIRAPDGVTSVNALYDEDIGQVISGPKDAYWSYILRKANEAKEWIANKGFTWSDIDHRWKEIFEKIDAIYVPVVRLDRGVEKVRLLFAGHAVIYVLESWISQGIKRDMRKCVHLAYGPKQGVRARDSFGNAPIISGDFQACDLHFNRVNMKAAWMAWQSVYELPESLMCFLYAYAVYAPIARWDQTGDEHKLVLQDREGINPSGSGAFVIIMNLVVRSLIIEGVGLLKEKKLETYELDESGLSFGDDHALPRPTAKLSDWVCIMNDFGQDVSKSEVWQGRFRLLRMLYGPSYEKVPIVYSRFRNAACPEDPGILSRSHELNAIALRAQLLPFSVMKQTSSRWKIVYEELTNILVPGDQMMLDKYPSDALLAKSVQFGAHEKDALFFSKRAYQVEDSVKVLLDR